MKMNANELIKDFQEKCPQLVKAMRIANHEWQVGQTNPFHREGDIFNHTCLVLLASVFRKSNWIVQLGALLHDTGKPIAEQRVEETQRVRYFGHEGASCYMAHRYLSTLNLTEEETVMLWRMICFHTYLYQRMKLPTFEQDVADTFRGEVKLLENLISLNAADALGRFSSDLTDEVRAFWENAEENLAHLVYKTQDFIPSRETKGEAIVLVGPPGSGKSTWLKKNSNGFKVVCRDDVIMALGKGKTYTDAYHSVKKEDVDSEYEKLRKEAAASKENVIFDLTHMTEKSRRKSLAGLDKNMKRTCVVFLSSYETLVARNEKRAKDTGKNIPERVLVQMIKDFSFPMRGEGFDEIKFVINKEEI